MLSSRHACRLLAHAAVASLTLLAAITHAAACGDGRMRFVVSDLDAQRALIAAGVLHANVGEAKCETLKAALDLYDKIYGAPTGDTSEKKVAAVKQRYTDFLTAFGMTEVGVGDARKMLVPSKLVALTESNANEWFYRTNPENVTIYAYRFGFKHSPPAARLRGSLKVDKQQDVKAFDLTTREFALENQDIRGNETKHRFRRAFVSGNSLVGHYVYYADTPAPAFVVPDYVAPLVSHLTPPRELLDVGDETQRVEQLATWAKERGLDGAQQSELADLARGSREPPAVEALLRRWMWRTSMEAIARLSASSLEEQSRWTTLKVDDCWRPGDRRYRIVFATNRAASGTLGNSLLAGSWFRAAAHDKYALTIGCAVIATPAFGDVVAASPVEARSAENDKAAEASTTGFSTTHARAIGEAAQTAEQIRLIDAERWLYPDEGQALVYVHGFNTSFESALYTAAQIAAATEYKGRIYLFSWPSAGSVLRYAEDMDGAERAEGQFTSFLRAVLSDPELRRIDFFAHSMGSQVLTRALNTLLDEFHRRDGLHIGKVILAAPDISTDVFIAKAREITRLRADITVYGSASDIALRASARLRGSTRRLGLIAGGVVPEIEGVKFIDATPKHNACTAWGYMDTGHSYLTENPAVLKHVSAVLSDSRRRNEADYVIPSVNGKYKVLKSEAPPCWWPSGG